MGESKVECPACGRQPGGRHGETCPRSPGRQSALVAALKALGRARVVFVAKGPVRVTKAAAKRAGLKDRVVYNPGIPYVRPPRPWYAGGVPRNERMEEFARALGLLED